MIGLSRIARWTALGLWGAGTLILLLFYFTDALLFAILGVVLVWAGGVTSVALLAFLARAYYKLPHMRRSVLVSALLLCLNIPISLGYFYMGGMLLNTARITLHNPYPEPVAHLLISGCDKAEVSTLPPGASTTVWLHIPTDCALQLSYVRQGRVHTEPLSGYLTPGMGGQRAHTLGKAPDHTHVLQPY
jgi:hypothetical protein